MPRARAGLWPDRDFPGVTPHEPRWVRALARRPARRRGRLHPGWAVGRGARCRWPYEGLAVALSAGFISRLTSQGEDASFTVLYNTAIALGVVLISMVAPSTDLIGLLFGDILAMDDTAMVFVACSATLTAFVLALIYRPLVTECFDPLYLRAAGGRGALVQVIFLGGF